MFSVIKNIYNKNTKGPTLMELFTATGKLNFFLTTKDVRFVHHGWHGTHRYDIQVLTTYASVWVHWYSSLLQRSVPSGPQGYVAIMGRTNTSHHYHVTYKYVPPIPRDLAYLKAAVKNINAPMLTLYGKNMNIVSMYAVSPVVHTSNISSCQKMSVLLWLWTIPLR
jgi:hypothetical protein